MMKTSTEEAEASNGEVLFGMGQNGREIVLVRCVVYGVESEPEYGEILAFLRAFAVLYGDGLAVTCESSADATIYAKVRENVAQNEGVSALNNPSGSSHVQPCVHVMADERDFQANAVLVEQIIIYGKQALQNWMRKLLEARFSTTNSIVNTGLNGTSAASDYALRPPPLRLFVSGDRSQVGKSTVCLGLIGSLLEMGYHPSELGYIKPATQCEKPQLIAKFCRQNGIICCDIGPILFYSGFTREFLRGNTDSSAELLAKAKAKVDEIGRGKKVVIVDGVGYPGVGSICGVSNAAVAAAVHAPVVLVGKKGVGDAVDSFNINACFFESYGVPVLGAIFNRLPAEGFYSLDKCKEHVTSYFHQYQPDKTAYGFLPELLTNTASSTDKDTDSTSRSANYVHMTPEEAQHASRVIGAFRQAVDLNQLLADAKEHQSFDPTEVRPANVNNKRTQEDAQNSSISKAKKSRQQIQAEAKVLGASGGCM